MTTLFIVLIVIASIAMILIVLVQKSKGGGLSSSFSGSNAILGYKKTTDTVEKVTWLLASVIMILCIATVSLTPRGVSNAPAVGVETYEEATPDMSTGIPTFPAPVAGDNNE